MRSLRAVVPAAVTVGLLLALWVVMTAGDAIPDYIIPAPDAVLRSILSTWPDRLGPATLVTGLETVAGLAVGVVAALVIVTLDGFLPVIGRALTPLLVLSQAIPVVVIGPLLTISLGYGVAPKVIVVALLCFFPVALNLLAGVRDVDPRLVATMRSLDASRLALFWRLRFPSALPRGLAGLRVSVTYAPVAAVFAEYTGATDGIGYLMLQAIPRMQTDFVFAQVIVLTTMAGLLLGVVTFLGNIICPWAHSARKESSQ
ncbi:ABC transporter permease [Tessaracoccus caeni]|uniref:ABC transporter permease n=1 Tax=Tessaracoccus caeni TaxID=3031239 RepID=UPI0023DA86AE|nr:ABC transporter permease [Tessaracoccus caeni]MDF1488093.1 ABC transporter permease [Tessaracoccus caeni]